MTRALTARRRSIWDARRLLAPVRGRVLPFRWDDGQTADAPATAIVLDVVHTPRAGFGLVVRGWLPLHAAAERRAHPAHHVVSTMPLTRIRVLPPPLRFLAEPRDTWPLPPAIVSCPRCHHALVTGRFCGQCGRVAQRGSARLVFGEGFSALQLALRQMEREVPDVVRHCACGARQHRSEPYCAKCGTGRGAGDNT